VKGARETRLQVFTPWPAGSKVAGEMLREGRAPKSFCRLSANPSNFNPRSIIRIRDDPSAEIRPCSKQLLQLLHGWLLIVVNYSLLTMWLAANIRGSGESNGILGIKTINIQRISPLLDPFVVSLIGAINHNSRWGSRLTRRQDRSVADLATMFVPVEDQAVNKTRLACFHDRSAPFPPRIRALRSASARRASRSPPMRRRNSRISTDHGGESRR